MTGASTPASPTPSADPPDQSRFVPDTTKLPLLARGMGPEREPAVVTTCNVVNDHYPVGPGSNPNRGWDRGGVTRSICPVRPSRRVEDDSPGARPGEAGDRRPKPDLAPLPSLGRPRRTAGSCGSAYRPPAPTFSSASAEPGAVLSDRSPATDSTSSLSGATLSVLPEGSTGRTPPRSV